MTRTVKLRFQIHSLNLALENVYENIFKIFYCYHAIDFENSCLTIDYNNSIIYPIRDKSRKKIVLNTCKGVTIQL